MYSYWCPSQQVRRKSKVFADLAKLRLSSADNSGLRKRPPSFSGATIMGELRPEKRMWFRLGSFWGWHCLAEQARKHLGWPESVFPAPFGLWTDPCTAFFGGSSFSRREAGGQSCCCLTCSLLEHSVLACSRQPSSSSSTRGRGF